MKKLSKFFTFLILIAVSFTFTIKNINVKASNLIDVSSKSAYLMDYNSGTVIFAQNENERRPIASMTKIMLLLLAYENVNNGNLSLDEEVVVSENASGMGGSQVFLENGGKYKVSDLLKSITVASANDASVCIAERLYGSEKSCVEKMNSKASELGLKNTLFANCTGLPKPMQYSSAKDIAIIFSNLIKHKEYFKYSTVWMDKIDHIKNSTEITNTNKLVKFYEGCDGGKTGFTNEAGFCLTATAKRGNMRLIGSVINAQTSKERFSDVSTMFNYGFANYCNKCVVDDQIPLDTKIKISNSKQKEVDVIAKKDFYVFSKRNEKVDVTFEINTLSVKAPLNKGDVVGEITVYKNGVEIGKVDIITMQKVDEMTYFDYVKEIAGNWA